MQLPEEEGAPSWRDEKLGTMKRGALWLVQVVGEGNVFTKAEMRSAFPETAQIDRRIRDLRDYGWRIDTRREDPGLDQSEQRFVSRGAPVWEPGKAVKKEAPLSAVARRDILQRDGHLCRSCGISAGERFSGSYATAHLDLARRKVALPDGSAEVQLVTECNRCRIGGGGESVDVGAVLEEIRALPNLELGILREWIERDRRRQSDLERLWALYRSLPGDARELIRGEIVS